MFWNPKVEIHNMLFNVVDELEVKPGIFITKNYALWLEEKECIVIADLHLGFEGVLYEEGFAMPRFQKTEMIKRLRSILSQYSPKRLIINGDLKHEFSRNLHQEWKEVNEVLDFLEGKVELHIIRGNHDNYLKTILSKRGLPLKKRIRWKALAFAHGHEELDWKDLLIIGHEHPSVKLSDEIGASIKVPCFLVGKEVIVLPAFSPLAYGTDVTQMAPISPPLDGINFKNLEVFTIDENLGILSFGKLEELS
jgi:putative SbcD/Mre11-related phosphoesterase